jgi:hypothetical protein
MLSDRNQMLLLLLLLLLLHLLYYLLLHLLLLPSNACCLSLQSDDSGTPIKVVRGREADPAELSSVMERAEHYQDRRDASQSTMQTVSQLIT